MSDETRNDEIRNCWFGKLLQALNEANESAETDAERELMVYIVSAIQGNVLFEPKRAEDDSDE